MHAVSRLLVGAFAFAFVAGGLYVYQNRWDETSQLPIVTELTDTWMKGIGALTGYTRSGLPAPHAQLDIRSRDASASAPRPNAPLEVRLTWHSDSILHKIQGNRFSKGKQKQALKYIHYIDTYKAIALRDMYHSNVFASIKLAQGLLESDAGLSKLTRNSNNHFGIKARHKASASKKIKAGYTRDLHDGDFNYSQPAIGVYNAHDDHHYDRFEVYHTAGDSYERHTQLLTRNCPMGRRGCYGWIWDAFPAGSHSDITAAASSYQSVSKISPGAFFDGKTELPYYAAAAAGLKMAGYATSPQYHKKIAYIIETYELWRLDLDLLRALQAADAAKPLD